MKETLLKLKEYNKTISKLTCSDLERSLIKEINDRDYFYGFSINKEYTYAIHIPLKELTIPIKINLTNSKLKKYSLILFIIIKSPPKLIS